MVVGSLPFDAVNPVLLQKIILTGKIRVPYFMSTGGGMGRGGGVVMVVGGDWVVKVEGLKNHGRYVRSEERGVV